MFIFTLSNFIVLTGFSTAKGCLVRSIMFPKNVGFKFFRDAIKFVAVLSVLAAIGFIYSCIQALYYHDDAKEIINRSLDLITTVVPPGLPAAMTVGIVYALQRLKKRNIYCISPPRVNMSGKIKLVCFDKTGTLTEDGLDLYGVIPSCNGYFQDFIPEGHDISNGPLLFTMATCHTLTYIQDKLAGDPIDLKMFQATGWVIKEHGTESAHYQQMIECEIRPRRASSVTEIMLTGNCTFNTDTEISLAVIKRFPFSSNLQRMSVIVSSLPTQKPAVYVKGAPEMIRSLSDPETIPGSFQDELTALTRQGYRVLALAWKPLEVRPLRADRLAREYVESNLRFLGLLVLQNKLKPETTPVIKELIQADIRCVMVTGDNIDTAISVAKECDLIHLEQRVICVDARINDSDHRLVVDYHSVSDHEEKMILTESTPEAKMDGYQTGRDKQSPQRFDRPAFVFAMTGKSFRLIQLRDLELLNKVETLCFLIYK
jgi:cation-transporting ATPase 13A3/4/5